MVEELAVRSENDDTPVTVNFFNESSWHALLLWFDYEGRRVLYASVGAGRSCGLFSFMTHPWVAVDSKSFLPMTLTVMDQNGSDPARSALSDALSVFTPSANYLSPQSPGTIHVSIHLPVLPLAELCKRHVQTAFPPALIRQLDLPQFLINSLLRPLVAPWHRLASSRS